MGGHSLGLPWDPNDKVGEMAFDVFTFTILGSKTSFPLDRLHRTVFSMYIKERQVT